MANTGSNSASTGPSDPGASLAAALLAALARQQRGQQQREMAVAPGPGLSEVLRPEVLAPLLQDPEVIFVLVMDLLAWIALGLGWFGCDHSVCSSIDYAVWSGFSAMPYCNAANGPRR